MKTLIIFTILSALAVIAMADVSENQVLQSNSLFTNQLYKILAEQPGNVFFSPISVHAVLSMAYVGSEGHTKEAFEKSLSLTDKASVSNGYQQIATKLENPANVTLYWANKIYVSNSAKLKENFSKTIVEKFKSEVQSVNFGASDTASTINKWVEQKTVNKIKDLISPNDLDALTRLVLVNAIYFKSNWELKFEKEATRTEPFYLNEKDKIDVQMMHTEQDFKYKYDNKLKAKIVELPYKNKEFSMVIILPDEKDGIKTLEAALEKVDLTKITDGASTVEVNLALPKFKIETTVNLNEPLKKVGLGAIFEPSADFSGILEGKERLSVSKAIQKAFIEVNEEGSEAAAATGIIINTLSAPMRRYILADHPFVFMLKKSSTILFFGKCTKPVSGDSHIAPRGVPVKDPFAHNIHIKLED